MVIETCLVLITVVHLAVATSLFFVFFKAKKSIDQLGEDWKEISAESIQLLTSLNQMVKLDLRAVSTETTRLLSKTSELISDFNEKSKSINSLFEPLHPENESLPAEHQRSSFSGVVKWVSRGLMLIKLAKELTKNGKS